MAKETRSKAPTLDGTVRIVVPADVAFDLGRLQKGLANLAERLGCRPCLSGADCTFLLEREFIVDPASLEVRPFSAMSGRG